MQRLAAELVRDCWGLDRRTDPPHIGGICDAIIGAGIDPTAWSARAVTDALKADMVDRGSSWPDLIERPGAFLASRLRRIDWTPPAPVHSDGGSAAGQEQGESAPSRPAVASAATRAAVMAAARQVTARAERRAARRRTEEAAQATARFDASVAAARAPRLSGRLQQKLEQRKSGTS